MDINNTTNVISSSRINSLSAKQAFEASKKPSKPQETEDFKEEDIKLIDKKIQKSRIDVSEIQKYAQDAGENLSIDDINYGLMYGRSVIVDYCV